MKTQRSHCTLRSLHLQTAVYGYSDIFSKWNTKSYFYLPQSYQLQLEQYWHCGLVKGPHHIVVLPLVFKAYVYSVQKGKYKDPVIFQLHCACD